MPYEVSDVIGFSGTILGRAVVSFTWPVANGICQGYLQLDTLPEGAVEDCVGELANVIVVRAKSALSKHSIIISPQRGALYLSLPCACKHGPLQLDMSIVENNAMGAKL